jgi:hypothetical protein
MLRVGLGPVERNYKRFGLGRVEKKGSSPGSNANTIELFFAAFENNLFI